MRYKLWKVHIQTYFLQQMDVKYLSAMLLLYFLLPDTKHSKLASHRLYGLTLSMVLTNTVILAISKDVTVFVLG